MKSIDKARLEFIRDIFIDRLISERDLAEQYDEFLDELNEIKIGVIKLWPSEVLKKMDPIAYNEGLRDYMSGMEEVLLNLYANDETLDDIDHAWNKLLRTPDQFEWAEVAMPPLVALIESRAGVSVYEHPEKGDEAPLIVVIEGKAYQTDEFDKMGVFYALEVA